MSRTDSDRQLTHSGRAHGIDGRTGAEISGSFTVDSAQDLAEILEIGALPVRLELVSRSQVSASLGQQAGQDVPADRADQVDGRVGDDAGGQEDSQAQKRNGRGIGPEHRR